MNLSTKSFFALTCTLTLSACGTASVQYSNSSATPVNTSQQGTSTDPVAIILAAAASGSQTLDLPVSRLVVAVTMGTKATNVQQGTAAQEATPGQQGNASPPSKKSNGKATVTGQGESDASPPPAPAAAPGHNTANSPSAANNSSPTAQPITPPKQSTKDAANQPGGTTPAKTTTPASTVTTTLTAADGTTYAISVVQADSTVSFRVRPTNDFFSENDLGVTRLANTRIPTSVSNTFTDQTASRVKTIASIAGAAATLAAAAAPSHTDNTAQPATAVTPPDCTNAENLTVDDELVKTVWSSRKSVWNLGTDKNNNCLDITLTPQPPAPDLVPIASLVKGAFAGAGGDWNKVWPVPACMTVNVTVAPHGVQGDSQQSASGQITLIDPDYVELMPIPQKGQIAMHPICGADLTNSATDPYQADFDTISAIIAAYPAKKSSN